MSSLMERSEYDAKVSELNDRIIDLVRENNAANIAVMKLNQEVINAHAALVVMLVKGYTTTDNQVFISDETISDIQLDTFKLGAKRDEKGKGLFLKAYKIDELQEMLGANNEN